MIKINRKRNITFLNATVSDFADSLGYCEYKIPLAIKGVKPKPSKSLVMGTKAHHAEEKFEQEHFELEPVLTKEIEDEQKDIEFARENVYSKLSIPFEFQSENILLFLSGRIDKIMRVGGTLLVQDDKFVGDPQTYDHKTQPYPSQLLQVLVYLNSIYSAKKGDNPEDWFDIPHNKKKWQIRICYRDTREPYKIFSEYQDAFYLHYLHLSLERFTSLALGVSEPDHHNNRSKCNACNFKNFCHARI